MLCMLFASPGPITHLATVCCQLPVTSSPSPLLPLPSVLHPPCECPYRQRICFLFCRPEFSRISHSVSLLIVPFLCLSCCLCIIETNLKTFLQFMFFKLRHFTCYVVVCLCVCLCVCVCVCVCVHVYVCVCVCV